MNAIDRVFVVVFDRYRRGRRTRDISQNWRAAEYEVGIFLTLPLVVFGGAIFFLLQSYLWPLVSPRRWHLQLFVVFLGLAMFLILEKRFSKFQIAPPPLESVESTADRQVIWRFRLLTTGIFIIGLGVTAFVGIDHFNL